MDGFAARQHPDKFFDLGGARFRLIGVVNAVENCVAVGAGERGEESGGWRVFVESDLKIVRDRGLALGRVGGLPSAIGFGALYFSMSGGMHAALGDQLLGLGPVDFRPFAAGRARGKSNQPELAVVGLKLTVDPAVAERGVDGFRFGHAWYFGIFFG